MSQSQGDQGEQAPIYLRYGARGLGTAAGIFAMGIGLFQCLTLTPAVFLAGIYMIIMGFVVISAEAPCCCMFVEIVSKYSAWVEARPHWQKAVTYVCLPIMPVILTGGSLAVIFSCALIFMTGVLYGMMSLGKKSSRSDMIASAQASSSGGMGGMKSTLVNMEVPPATS